MIIVCLPAYMVTYSYAAYSLQIQSDFPLPELAKASNGDPNAAGAGMDARVHIRWGAAPDSLLDPGGQSEVYQISSNQFLLCVDQVARYLVQNGDEIIVQPAPGVLASDMRVFLLGSCFGALLHQRGLLVLHASAIHTDRGAVLFAGPSGSGKSTLLGALLNRGHAMIVDDVCAVEVDGDGTPVVLPAYPRTGLWADAAAKLAVATEGLERTRPDLDKYERQLPHQFWAQPARLRHVYLLTTTEQSTIRLEPLPRIQRFGALLDNTYRHYFLDGLETRGPHFALAAAVASAVGITRIVRPSARFDLAALADLVEGACRRGPTGSLWAYPRCAMRMTMPTPGGYVSC